MVDDSSDNESNASGDELLDDDIEKSLESPNLEIDVPASKIKKSASFSSHKFFNLADQLHVPNFKRPVQNVYLKYKLDRSVILKRWRKNILLAAEDWIFLALLGTIMAFFSVAMDQAIEQLQLFHLTVFELSQHSSNDILPYCIWVSYSVFLVTLSAIVVRYLEPHAIGSGIPEMKTILRGVILKEYLTLKTLISKMIGLTLSLGSGIPIGKEGPFVHVASVVANLLSRFVHSSRGIYENESRRSEMLAAGCAVGVACTFSAPVGGVLFSIEVTSVYFAVRNYWRGFFAAACSATLFRILRSVFGRQVIVVAFHQTTLPLYREAFHLEELPIFAWIGLICGILSACFIVVHRNMVLFMRSNKCVKTVLQRIWMVCPILITIIITSIIYPNGYGSFLGGIRRFGRAPIDFFKNCTWTSPNCTGIDHWKGPDGEYSIFLTLFCFIVTFFFLIALASTLPVPAGIFGPSFVLGAAMGRLIGEYVAILYPDGLYGPNDVQIFPGLYSIVGAAAFCGGVTHTVSVAVIVFEMTGQIYILPVMIAVLISNCICSYLQPSIYDSIIKLKKLPYLPDIPPSASRFHTVRVEHLMTKNVKHLSKDSTYSEVAKLLLEEPHFKAFPIVKNNENMILIGSCSRHKLLRSLENHLGNKTPDNSTTMEKGQQLIDLEEIGVDPAPFQLVENTPFFKLHSLFLLLGLNRAYVTDCGKLVGVVSLRDNSINAYNPFRIGLSTDGTFIPDHIDFEVCFGFSHTSRAAKFISFVPVLSLLFQIIIMSAIRLYMFLAIVAIEIPFCASLIYGVYRKKCRWLIPFLVFGVVGMVFSFGCIILAMISVLDPKFQIYYEILSSFFVGFSVKTVDTDAQLITLLMILMFSINFALTSWSIWSMYIYYHYLRGLERLNIT